MYNDYFGFSESPFNITPSSRFYYRTPCCEEVFDVVQHGIETRKGIIVVIGEPGTGKTLLLNYLVHDLGTKVRAVVVENPHIDFSALLRLLLNRLELRAASDDVAAMFDRLTGYLIEQRRNGRIVCLLIDEAQDLDGNTLDELRLLSNLVFQEEALLPIVLLGQAELNNKLDQPLASRIKQRVVLTRRIYPLIRKEIGPYIDFRLKVAKYAGADLFDPAAIAMIAGYSRGIPRMVNVICDNSLIRAYTAKQSVISPEIIELVARELRIAAPLSVQEQSWPAGNSDFSTETAPFADDADSVVRDVTPSPTEEQMVKPADVKSPAAETAPPHGSDSTAIHQPVNESALYRYADNEAQTTSVGESPRNSGLDPGASNDGLPASHTWLGIRHSFTSFRLPWYTVAALITLLLLVIGYIVGIYQSDGIYSALSTASRATAGGAPFTQPQYGLAIHSVEPNSALVAPPGPASVTSEPEKLEIAANQPSEEFKATPSNAPSDTAGKNSGAIQAPQSERLQDAESQRAAPANSKPRDESDSKPPNVTLEVVGASILRARPSDNAEIIGNLEPGSRIAVLAKSRDYYHVRSLDKKSIRGYVHREDAFFGRKK